MQTEVGKGGKKGVISGPNTMMRAWRYSYLATKTRLLGPEMTSFDHIYLLIFYSSYSIMHAKQMFFLHLVPQVIKVWLIIVLFY